VKLVTYQRPGEPPRAGVLAGEEVIDAARALALERPLRDVGQLLCVAVDVLERLRERLDAPGCRLPLAEGRLRAPILRPPTIRDFSAFETHVANAVANQGLDGPPPSWYRAPAFYFSNPLTVLDPESVVKRPAASSQLDYELEVAMVIGREGSDVPASRWREWVAGFTLFNDFSARELCVAEYGALGIHKGKDFAQGLGPWLLTCDELEDRIFDDRLDLSVRARVNGETWSESTTRDMHWGIGELLAYASRDSVVAPGDVIGFGTVGNGCVFEHPAEHRWLADADVVELEGERLGILRHTVRT